MPTLAIGVFGWKLLREEEARLLAAEAAARTERARIVSEDLTLLLEEARAGILAGLSEMPSRDPEQALQVWQEAYATLAKH